MTRALSIASLVASISLIAAVYLISEHVFAGGILLALGLLGLIGLLRCWTWTPGIGLFTVFGFSAAGFFLDLPSGLGAGLTATFLISGGLTGLLAWDLSDFNFRLRLASSEDDLGSLERGHLLRLSVVGFIGFALSLLALMVKAKFSFEWSVALIVIGVFGIGALVRWLMRH